MKPNSMRSAILSFLLIIALTAAGHAQTVGPNNSNSPSYQVRLLSPGRVQDTDSAAKPRDTVSLNGLIRVGVYGDLAKQITEAIAKDKPSAAQNLRLHLKGVAMEGLRPTIYPPDTEHTADPKPVWVLEFQLSRTPHEKGNRESWDAFLPRLLSFGENKVQIGISYSGSPPA